MIKKQYLINAINAALKAGDEILKVYALDFEVEQKKDNSPLTEADKASNNVIVERLEPTGIPIISEEIKNIPYNQRADWKECWIVDPLDGTKEFIKRNGEFTVNIALVSHGVPVAGVVYIPVSGTLYFAAEELGSFSINLKDKHQLPDWEVLLEKAEKLPATDKYDKYTIVASRSHLNAETEKFIEECKKEHGEVALMSRGSSIKLCMVAEGKAQVYPRIAPTMEWDTAAAHAIAKYAGCEVLNFETKKELVYNKENLLNPFFIVKR